MVMLPGMSLFFDVCRERLARENVKLDPDLFVRHLFGHSLSRGLAALLEKAGKSAEAAALAADCNAAYVAALQGAGGKLPDGLVTFIQDVMSRGVKVGLITQLPDEAARQVFAGVLNESLTVVTETPSTACVHGWEGWRRTCRKLQLRERLCVAVTSPASSRGALAAAMRVVAVTNPMQDFLDCSGVDVLTESFSAPVRATALGLLKLP